MTQINTIGQCFLNTKRFFPLNLKNNMTKIIRTNNNRPIFSTYRSLLKVPSCITQSTVNVPWSSIQNKLSHPGVKKIMVLSSDRGRGICFNWLLSLFRNPENSTIVKCKINNYKTLIFKNEEGINWLTKLSHDPSFKNIKFDGERVLDFPVNSIIGFENRELIKQNYKFQYERFSKPKTNINKKELTIIVKNINRKLLLDKTNPKLALHNLKSLNKDLCSEYGETISHDRNLL